MLKLARRATQAEKQAAKRLEQKLALEAQAELRRASHTRKQLLEEVNLQTRQARRLRRELWTMGDLAPRHDHAGAVADETRRGQASENNRFGSEIFANEAIAHWGSLSLRRLRGSPSAITPREAAARCAWAGTPKRLCLAVGDRVVVMEGHFKGSIGAIKTISADDGTVTVEGVARTNVTVPEAMVPEANQAVQQMESAIPIDAVRLVHPLTDAASGVTRDVIIRELRPVGFQLDRATRRLAFSRIVPGLNVRIPWPRPATPPPEHDEHAADTLRIDAELVTFLPTLLRPPAPEAVLDELRNRFSRFRTRHTPEYLARKEAQEARIAEAKRFGYGLVRGREPHLPPAAMRTPLDEFHLQQKALRRARGQPELTDEMLEKIGRLMAQNRGLGPVGADSTSTSSGAAQAPAASS